MPSKIIPNPGAQADFIADESLYAAYMGGVGSGKSFAGEARGIKYSAQPKVGAHGPRGTIAAATYPHIRDTLLPMMEELVNQTGIANWSRDYKRSERTLYIPQNGGEIRFRSLDDPDKVVRGPELAWIMLDEGRNLTMYHWKLCVGRLRQPGYKRSMWTCSTPSGFDWQWQVFHEDSENHWDQARWFNAASAENPHLPPEYLEALSQGWEGRFYEQEVLGKFVGVIEGGVFPFWDPIDQTQSVTYEPLLPLYTFWDFGYGDLGVVVFAQIKWLPKSEETPDTLLPHLYIIDCIAAKEWTSEKWAEVVKEKLAFDFDGRESENIGDPAGGQRQGTSGKSYIDDLAAHGLHVYPAPKRPQDYSIRILNNMMAGGRVVVDPRADEVSKAFSSHHWNTDGTGIRKGNNPVHDWTSHYVDAVRYGVTTLLHYGVRTQAPEKKTGFAPNQYGYVFDQLLHPKQGYRLGRRRPQLDPGIVIPQPRVMKG